MKYNCSLTAAAAAFLTSAALPILAQQGAASLIYETPNEFFATSDFDRDGRTDLVIVDKASGKYRIGYQLTPGVFSWVDCRPSGIKDIAGFGIGPLLAPNQPSLVFTSPDGGQINIVEAASPTAPGKPVSVSFTAAIGPNLVVPVDIGGVGKTPLADLYVGSIYNSPDANLATLLRNDSAQFPKLTDATLAGPPARGNRLSLKAGQPDLLCLLIQGDSAATLSVQDLSSGKPVAVATAADLPAGADYTAGNFGGSPLRQFIVYKPGDKTLRVRPVEEPQPGKFQFGKGQSFDLDQAVQRVIALNENGGNKLFVIFGEGEKAGVFDFDGTKAPALLQSLTATNNVFTCAATTPDGFIVFSQPTGTKFRCTKRAAAPSPSGRSAASLPSRTTTTLPSRTSTPASPPNKPRPPRTR